MIPLLNHALKVMPLITPQMYNVVQRSGYVANAYYLLINIIAK